MSNLVERDARINGRIELVELSPSYDDSMVTPTVRDMLNYPLTGYLLVKLGDTTSTTGDIRLEESDGDGKWSPLVIFGFAANTELFAKFQRTKRYLRIPAIGLEAATTTELTIDLFY